MLQLRFRSAVLILSAFWIPSLSSAGAQTPIALPYTMSTLAGTSPMAPTTGTQCPNLPTGVKSTDTFGDGCLAVNGIFGAAGRGGVEVDAFGNVFVADDISSIIHVINPTTGIMTVLAGGGTVCSTSAGKVDSSRRWLPGRDANVIGGQRGIGIDPWRTSSAGLRRPPLHMDLPHRIAVVHRHRSGHGIGSRMRGSTGATALLALAWTIPRDTRPDGNSNAAFNNAGSCSTSLGEVDTPRGVTADKYGNVYYADTASERNRVVVGPLTSTYFTGNNPLYAALGVNYSTVTQGYVYTVSNIAGTGSQVATVKGATCAAAANRSTLEPRWIPIGDGCPLEYSTVAQNSSYTSGIAVDASGNMIFADPSHGLRVFFVSGPGLQAR